MDKPLFTVSVPRSLALTAGAAFLIPLLFCSEAVRAQTAANSATGQQSRPTRASVRSKTENDLRRFTFKTEAGELVLTLPDKIAPGDTVSGTITRTPSGKSDDDRGMNSATLRGYSVELASLPPTRVDASRELVVFTLPGAAIPGASNGDRGSTAVPVLLRDAAAQEIGRTTLPLLAPTDLGTASGVGESGFVLPTSGIERRTLSIRGRFDGDAATTKVGIGDQDAAVVAESPRLTVVQTPAKALGKSQITLQEGTAAPVQGNFDHKRYRRNRTDAVIGGVLLLGVGAFIYLMTQLDDMLDGFSGFGS